MTLLCVAAPQTFRNQNIAHAWIKIAQMGKESSGCVQCAGFRHELLACYQSNDNKKQPRRKRAALCHGQCQIWLFAKFAMI
jgi:hypothetical protein